MSVIFWIQVPLFKQGFDEQGLKSVWQDDPVKYLLQTHPNELVFNKYLQKPFAEQFDKQLFISIFWVNKSTSSSRFKWNNELNAKM